MIWHTGRESYRHLLKVLSLLCYSVNVSNVFCFIQSHIITYLTYWYILLYIIHILHTLCHTIQHYIIQYILYIPYLHTLLYMILYIHIYSYAHIFWYSDTTTTPHDLLLLHQDIHIIPVYMSPSAMPYIIIYHTNNRIQIQDRQQTDI